MHLLHFIAMAYLFGVTPMQIATALMLRPACCLLGVQHSGQHHLQTTAFTIKCHSHKYLHHDVIKSMNFKCSNMSDLTMIQLHITETRPQESSRFNISRNCFFTQRNEKPCQRVNIFKNTKQHKYIQPSFLLLISLKKRCQASYVTL